MKKFFVTIKAFGMEKRWHVEGVDAADARAKALKEVGLTITVEPPVNIEEQVRLANEASRA